MQEEKPMQKRGRDFALTIKLILNNLQNNDSSKEEM